MALTKDQAGPNSPKNYDSSRAFLDSAVQIDESKKLVSS
jgi:hypothetical protein